jgi:hypothetical protein
MANNFQDYAQELLRQQGDSTTKQIWDYLPPEGRREMSRLDVDNAMEGLAADGLVVRVQRHWRLKATTQFSPETIANLVRGKELLAKAQAARATADPKYCATCGVPQLIHLHPTSGFDHEFVARKSTPEVK